MKLLKDRVLAEKIPDGNNSSSGIYLGRDLLQENRAKVLLKSDKVRFLEVGDIVKYYPGTGAEVNYQGKDCIILEESNHIDRTL